MTTVSQELVVTVTPRNRANFRRLKTNSIQSVKRWEKENELLYAMMEDESEWLAKLFPDVVISPEFFFYALEDGSLLCRLANYIQEKAQLYSQKHDVPVPGKKFRYHTMSKCSREIKLFRSRENVQQFLIWCRSHGLPEAILFESNDVVQVDDYREGCRGVIICLMEIVRRTAKFDLDELPQLIQMEKEIEEDEAHSDTELSNEQGQVLDVEEINMTESDNPEVHADQPEIQSPSSLDSDSGVDSVFDQDEGENTASRLTEFSQEETEKTEKTTTRTVTTVRKQTSPKDHKSSPKKGKELPSLLESTGPKSELDKQVCKLAQDYNIKVVHRLKEGKYIILGRIMFVRMLNDHMLVRIGGGWDTLEHYLMTHAPSKEALETPSTPSSQAATSPRNSISAGSGGRTSLFERVKRKEQVGVVNRDSAVYSSQGSLNQQLGAATSPKIRDKAKRESLKDEKDITAAIRKISTSVSQTLADRPVSFTNKTFHQLKSRFDKGIFGEARRTSSPDISLKGNKIRRRLSDTTTMADVATTLAFDGEQMPVANNNDTESKQPENAEEQGVGKVVAPGGDLLGDASLQTDIATPGNVVSDETDSSIPVGDLLSTEISNQSHLNGDPLGGQVNGGANLVDVSSFDPFVASPQQGELVSTGNVASDELEEQPTSMDVVDNGALACEEQSPDAVTETTPEPSPRVDLGDLLKDTEPDSTLDASPRPVDLGDLLLDSEIKTDQEDKDELSPAVALEEEVSPGEMVPEFQTTDVEDARSDEPVASSVQEIPTVVGEPTSETLVETESESLKRDEQDDEVEQVKTDESVMNEDIPTSVKDNPPAVEDPTPEAVVETESESLKREEQADEVEQVRTDESVMNEDIPTSVKDNPPPVVDPTPEALAGTESELTKPEEESGEVEKSTPSEETVEEQARVKEEPTSPEESVLDVEPEPPRGEGEFGRIEETTYREAAVVEKESELHETEGKLVDVEEPPKEKEPANVEEPSSSEEAVIKSEEVSTEGAPEVDETTTQEDGQNQAADVQVAEKVTLKADDGKEDDKPVETAKVEKASATQRPSETTARPKSPPKAGPPTKQTTAKKPTGATRATSFAPAKKEAKAPLTKAPAPKPAASKAPAAKKPASAVAGAKKPATKPATTKADEQKKPEKPRSAAAARPSSKTSETKTQGATRPASTTVKKAPSSTATPAASKVPGKGAKDVAPTKSTPKTTTTRPPSAKSAATKTASSATKPASSSTKPAAKPTRTQSAKPVDSTDSGALAKKPPARPQSAKPKVTTTTTTVKKTTTTTTSKVGTGPVKSQTTTTKTVTQAKSGQPKTTTTTTTTTKTTAKPSAAKATVTALKKPGMTGAKSKTGGQPSAGAAGGKPKKKAEEPAKEKEVKQEEETQEPTTAVDEKPTEVVETSTEVVETVVEPPAEAILEDKSIGSTPVLAPGDQTTEPVEVSSEEIVEQSSVLTRVVTTETTTVIRDGEEQSSTTTEETTFEQSAGES